LARSYSGGFVNQQESEHVSTNGLVRLK
jgi:hypothetical protein